VFKQHERPFSTRLFLLYVICSLVAIFYIPTLVPLRPTASDSYIFGYNNRVGIALLLSFVAIGALWTRGLTLRFQPVAISPRIPLKHLMFSLVAVLLMCLAIYLIAGRFGGFGESSYEIDRTWLLTQGKVPYVDFEWPFGVALLYGPLLFHQVLSLSVVHAYYLFWVINCLVGTALLFAVINMVDYPTKYKGLIYFLLFCEWFPAILNMGTHYTLVRYASPLFFLLVIQTMLTGTKNHSRILAAPLSVAFTGILLLISPEIAIAYSFASVCVFLLSMPERNIGAFVALGGLLSALALIFWASIRLHVLDTMKASGGGADSFPIYFAPYILIFFAALFVCGCYVFRRFSQNELHDNTFGLIAYSIPMIAAALGRCDPGHVALNALGIFIASMFYVSGYRNLWKWYRGTFIVFLVVIPAIFGIWSYRSEFMRCAYNIMRQSDSQSWVGRSINYLSREYLSFASPAKQAKWKERLNSHQNVGSTEAVDLSVIYPTWHGGFLAPLGYKPNGFGSYLSKQVDYGHFEAFENANTIDAIREKLMEITSNPTLGLLLPEDFDATCKVDSNAEKRQLGILFAFPYFGRVVHPISARQPLCSYILDRYRLEQAPTLEDFMYGLWVLK
jgi:hypothetical protein